ncbi:MAG: ACT domain-containing protein [Bacteroidia bacterium]|nr:ACT domain-containing protein [Bacteroidia bacterium]
MSTKKPISELSEILSNLNPILHRGSYVYCSLPSEEACTGIHLTSWIQEDEGLSVIVEKHIADQQGWVHSAAMAWITLNVYSSLEAVGLTAKVSSLLAENGISCNLVAGYHHDHIFVPEHDKEMAMQLLRELSGQDQNIKSV